MFKQWIDTDSEELAAVNVTEYKTICVLKFEIEKLRWKQFVAP